VNSPKKIGVIDYGSGNLRSVTKSLEAAGAAPTLITSTGQLDALDAVVVPGQGAFRDCARNLRASGMWDALSEWIRADRPYLGICLGYQLLFESSEESPGTKGLGIFAGHVTKFTDTKLKIPHMGWNELTETRGPLFQGMGALPHFYFVHSYFPAPEDAALVSAYCDYGGKFAASISRGAVHATQFHPEKSQDSGQALLRNFLSSL
jgi:imidazole glycerol-phosphate synthase subunit HisH